MRVAPPELLVLTPPQRRVSLDLGELWAYRELLYFLAWRDVKIRYKQTALGAAWAILQPVLTMVVFTIFFGRVAKLPSQGLPYPLFSLGALVVWVFFSGGVAQVSNSLVSSANLITKVYFPRLVIPFASTGSGFVDLGLATAVLLAVCAAYQRFGGWAMLAAPLALLLAVVATLGVGTGLAALNVKYRDVRYVVPVMLQLWLLATPIAYPSSLISRPWRTLYGLNPMAGAVELFRWSMIGAPRPPLGMVALSCASAVALLAWSLVYFRKIERHFADVV